MTGNPSPEFFTSGNGPNYDFSAAAAAEILNLHFDPSQPKSVLFGRILFTILEAMEKAQQERGFGDWEPTKTKWKGFRPIPNY